MLHNTELQLLTVQQLLSQWLKIVLCLETGKLYPDQPLPEVIISFGSLTLLRQAKKFLDIMHRLEMGGPWIC